MWKLNGEKDEPADKKIILEDALKIIPSRVAYAEDKEVTPTELSIHNKIINLYTY